MTRQEFTTTTTDNEKIRVKKGSSNGIWLKEEETGELEFIGGKQLKRLIEEENR